MSRFESLKQMLGLTRRGPGSEPNPAPFIVGAPRSGTTLLRLMLDAHPGIAIPAETGFFSSLASSMGQGTFPDSAEEFLPLITRGHTWPDFGLDERSFDRELKALPHFS